MTTIALPTRQRQVLEYAVSHLRTNHAMPSLASISTVFGYRSLNSARCALRALEKKSWLTRNEAGALMLHPGRFAVTVQAVNVADAEMLALQVRPPRRAPRVAPTGTIDLRTVSAAQARVLDAVVRHGSNKGAAQALRLSVKTVETHRDNFRKTTGARSSLAALCAWAQERAMQGEQS